MSEIIDVVERWRAKLLAQDGRVQRQLMRDWRSLRDVMEAEADALAARMDRALAKGDAIPVSWLHTEGHLDSLLRQVEAEVDRFARTAQPAISGAVEAASTLGANGVTTMLSNAGVASTLNAAAVERALAATARPSPLTRVLLDMAPHTSDVLRRELVRGVALGENPLRVAARMRRVADVPLARARTVARTEQMRAYRGASHDVMRASSVVDGWTWIAGLDERTCVACMLAHGTEHPMTETLESHPNCRCVAAPLVASASVRVPAGRAVLAKMSEPELASRVGPGLAALVRSGKVTLDDLVAVRTSPVWGRSIGRASISQAVENAARRRARGRVRVGT